MIVDTSKNPDKMSESELRAEVKYSRQKIERLRKDRLCRCADEVRCEMRAEVERLRKGWESLEWESKQEIERLEAALEEIAERDPLESISASIARRALRGEG